MVLKADDRHEVDELRAGDLGAAFGLKDTLQVTQSVMKHRQ